MYKKIVIVNTTLIFVNIILFLISHWAFMRKQNDTSLVYPDAWFSQILLLIDFSRLIAGIITGMFFRKLNWFVNVEMNLKKYARIFCTVLISLGIYYIHRVDSTLSYYIVSAFELNPDKNYHVLPLFWEFVCEAIVPSFSIFTYITCWAMILFPKKIRHKKQEFPVKIFTNNC